MVLKDIMIIKSEKGSSLITMPIITTVIFLLMLIFIITFIHLVEPFVIYEKMSSSALKYIFIMEEYGFLTEKEEEKLKKELVCRGLKGPNLMIEATNSEQEYGDPIKLKIIYYHELNMPKIINSLIPQFKNEIMEINVEKQSFSKR